ncbi:hypothetical protein Thal_0970 [Thermocrinis albus DSM 14484]|uniref:Uncharacterized protein n=1 Tax=Thermocrinis albus (strain DSM 14484 / JCM 11386 / HI 11/12) TaxID=638303 RepID=D3SLH2_THEAH|nr:hypothetical protein [Thermocrinis albus]ADC89602.1 hypothetical protein Thal_0970 [Thermocrinis albus DSM 14484]
MRLSELSDRQREFLKNIFELDHLPDTTLEEFLKEKGCHLMECLGCGCLIFHDGYEFWNLTECCDDNSKLVEGGVLCEICYSRSAENLKHWIFFRPTFVKEVDFKGRL